MHYIVYTKEKWSQKHIDERRICFIQVNIYVYVLHIVQQIMILC